MQILSAAAQRFINSCMPASRSSLPQPTGPTKIGQPTLPRSGLSSFFNLRGPASFSMPDQAPLRLLRDDMLKILADCPEQARTRITVSIYRARTGMDLWLLRSDIFQCVSRERGQEEARRRINALRSRFANYVPKKQLVAI